MSNLFRSRSLFIERMFSFLRSKWLDLGISAKIRLLFSSLVLACLVVVFVNFLAHRRNADKLDAATRILLPAALLSQQADIGFNEELRLYEDAITIGDNSLLDKGATQAEQLDIILKDLCNIVAQDTYHVSATIRQLRQDLASYTKEANAFYTMMSKWSLGEYDITNNTAAEEQLVKNAAKLRKKATALQKRLSLVNDNCRELMEDQISDIGTQAKQQQKWGYMLALWALVLIPVISFFLARAITLPIIALATTVRRISKGGWSNGLVARGNDELADLTRAFTAMTAKLRRREDDLRKHRDHLEELVRQRTGELAESNERLRREVKERREAEEAATLAKELADAANQAKSLFLANMSHEIRTPMNAILGFTQLMERDENLTPSQMVNLNTISRSGEHLLALINDILEISKIEAGRISINPAVFDLHALLEDLQMMFSIRAKTKHLRLNIECHDELPQYILSDEGKLRQVLVNLLGNAVKFTDSGGISLRAKISGGKDDMRLDIEVEDSGCGIAAADRDDIFAAFHQSICGIEAKGGTGLGLAISQEYIHLLGGKIEVQSNLDTGSRFYFSLPVEEAEAELCSGKTKAYPRVIGTEPDQAGVRVLVVDDRDANRAFLSRLLTLIGFQVHEAINGREAVELSTDWLPDIVLMDINMPIMDGYEATTIIKIHNKNLPVIAVTASVFEDDFNKIMDAGCDAYIRKPFKEQEILDVIQEFTDVTYRYEEKTNEDDAIAVAPVPAPAELAALPEELRSRMLLAVTTLEGDVLLDCIREMDDEFAELAKSMRSMVDRYAFQEIAALLQEEPK